MAHRFLALPSSPSLRQRAPSVVIAWVVVCLIGLLGVITQAPAAEAAARPFISTASADMFWCTSAQSLCTAQTVTKQIPQGTPLRMICWRDDRAPFPNSSPRWFYTVLDNGQEGYVWASQVGGQVATPNCSTVNWVNVSDWVIGRDDGSQRQWRSSSLDGPFVPNRSGNYWSGWCLAFSADAWYQAGGAPTSALSYPSAISAWNGYAAQGRVDTTHRPPRGAMVFFNWTSSGHVAISLGNWRVVSTHGNTSDALPIYDFSFDPTTAGYLGWTMPVQASVPQNI